MNKKLVTIALAAIFGCLVIAAGLVFMLYHGTGEGKKNELLNERGYEMLSSVPTDAIAVVLPADFQSVVSLYSDESTLAWAPVASAADPRFRSFLGQVARLADEKGIQSLKGAAAVVSFHYTGALLPLLVVDDPKGAESRSEDAAKITDLADTLGLYSCWAHSRILVSTSDIVLQSALRHQDSDASVADAHGFAEAAQSVSGKNLLFVCVENCGKIFSEIIEKPYLKHADFFKTLGSWAVLSLDNASAERATAVGAINSSEGVQQYMKIFDSVKPAESSVATILPERISWAFSLPSPDMQDYVKGYQSYSDSRIGLSKFLAKQKALQDATGVVVKSWFNELGITEAAVAGIDINGTPEQFILLKVSNPNADCKEGVNEFKYGGYVAALLGNLYATPDQSCATYKEGWLIIGSNAGISAYVDGAILENRLVASNAFAAHTDVSGGKNQLAWFWYPVTGNSRILRDVFRKSYEAGIEAASYGLDESFMMTFTKTKTGTSVVLDLAKPAPVVAKKKKDAQEAELEIPQGPFTVKNSGTGKDNLLSCANGLLALSEDGTDLWSVPFDGSLCGRVANVDNFANGKIQFLFCSGGSLYMYDRLGRPVSGFPVALEQPVLLGPDVYDFNNNRRYNIVVLNQDNSIDMYNLKGQKPSGWQTIYPKDKPSGLPEYITRGKNNYWVVYTAEQTLVYPFKGGEPVAEFTGHVISEQITIE